MSFTLKKSHQLFIISKFLIIFAQLIATFYLILWNVEFWQSVQPQITEMLENSTITKNLEKSFDIISPSIVSILIYFVCLMVLHFFKTIILNISIKPKNIVNYEHTGEIKPLFARRIASHYKWNEILSLQDFFVLYKESNNQESILKKHQDNKEFYDFLCKYDNNLSKDFPYNNPRTTVIRREELLEAENAKLEPFIDDGYTN